MDKFNFVRSDGMSCRLPPGFRFQPSDEELVFQYLKCKVLSWPLPASIIPEIHYVCKYDPWDLPGDLEQERYFFSNKEAKYPNGNRVNRTTASGYWKATGLDKQIVPSSSSRNNNNNNNHVIMGMKKTLVFYKGKPPQGSRTDWVMHEYRLVRFEAIACNFPSSAQGQNSFNQLANWVLCRIFLKNRSSTTKADYEIINSSYHEDNKLKNAMVVTQPRFYDFMTRDSNYLCPVSSTSPSSSSGSTSDQASSSGEDHDESSTRNVF